MTPTATATKHKDRQRKGPKASRNGHSHNGDRKGKRKKRRLPVQMRDRHRLYESSVQSPEVNIEFFDRVYKRRNGFLPSFLKEDFCGTALLAANWVLERPGNRAIGVDLDEEVLAWARENNIDPLGEEAKRVQLVRADVREVREPKVDVVAALNFSYFIFRTHRDLCGYFRAVRESLRPGGVFVMDIFGGWESQMEVTDKTRHNGYTYVWEQDFYNPVTNETRFYIHFKFHGGGGIKRAFRYDWRIWTPPEVRDALHEVGFENVDVYWEGVDEDGEGDGTYRRVKKAENCPGWIALIAAS